MSQPVIVPATQQGTATQLPIAANGSSFDIHEWKGSGPPYLHIHYHDDEAWHILEGTLVFRFIDREVEAPAGTTIFVPAGVAHTYFAKGSARYLIILTPRLRELIVALQAAPMNQHSEIMKKYDSEILD